MVLHLCPLRGKQVVDFFDRQGRMIKGIQELLAAGGKRLTDRIITAADVQGKRTFLPRVGQQPADSNVIRGTQ